MLDRPVDGVLFDVEHAGFWYPGWGERPADLATVLDQARAHLATVPRLVPVYAHRFLPAGRGTSGHPVLSVHQTDIVFAGFDVADYLHREFAGGPTTWSDDAEPETTVAFWLYFTG
ncbi:hypothetical protein [Actinoplanes palleronii]|uniref:Uncharacterized protein n=1 Tax=Actinoplanes palleronii TaxID=113570 RepID=A0ABQ4BN55_9ACTN|nr:hypothetical protein [Actinoplanes palleronii]GIE72075.1 hypothetical protein Apa02nite_081830 [Actinoplanes palleronii]